jgi:hypothetical protein
LPRQARDKHRENLKKSPFCQANEHGTRARRSPVREIRSQYRVHLPRQARDRRTETLNKRGVFRREWLLGFDAATLKHNMTMQMCMQLPSNLMQSLEMDSVTNARSSGAEKRAFQSHSLTTRLIYQDMLGTKMAKVEGKLRESRLLCRRRWAQLDDLDGGRLHVPVRAR